MLFGMESNWKQMLNHAQEIAKEKNFEIVYAATMGSISRGIPAIDSDYDIRFLYIKKDFPEVKYNPKECKEEDIIYRFFRDAEHKTDINICYTYDRMAFWELTAFLNLLVEPQIGTETRNREGLYYVVEHTFLSPYTWDPYGIQQKVLPFIYKYSKSEYVNIYCQRLKAKVNDDKHIYAKQYIDAVWASLCLKWIEEYGSPAPIDFETLVTVINDKEVREYIKWWTYNTIENCNKEFIETENKVRGFTRKNVICERDSVIDRILRSENDISSTYGRDLVKKESLKVQYEQIDMLIDAIAHGIKQVPEVLGISKE